MPRPIFFLKLRQGGIHYMTERRQLKDTVSVLSQKIKILAGLLKYFFSIWNDPILLPKWPKNVLLLTMDQIYIQHVYSTLYFFKCSNVIKNICLHSFPWNNTCLFWVYWKTFWNWKKNCYEKLYLSFSGTDTFSNKVY